MSATFYSPGKPFTSRIEVGALVIQEGWIFRVYVVDVAGSTVTIVVGDRQGGSFALEARAVLDSIVWKDLG